MSNQETGRESPRGLRESGSQTTSGQSSKSATATAADAYSKVSSVAGDAADKAKDVVSSTASTLTRQAKSMLDHQVDGGAEKVEQFAGAVRRAANELDRDLPQIAGLVRTAADRVDDFAHQMKEQSVDDIAKAAADFTRRQPALVFGLGALLGFFAFRTFKSAPTQQSVQAPPIVPTHQEGDTRTASQFHGV